MKKFTCKMIPKNEELKTEEFEIEVEDCCREHLVFKYVFLGALAAFCMGMTIALFAWTAYACTYGVTVDFLRVMIGAIVAFGLTTAICGTVVVCRYISVNARAKCQLEAKVKEAVAKKCATEKTEEKGINFKISKF